MGNIRILVAEAKRTILDDLRSRLLARGYEVCGAATSGGDAVRLAAELHPDLVVIDIHLDGAIDPIAAATQIRERTALPVIFLITADDIASLERAHSVEPLGYIRMPFDDHDLRVTIELALTRARMEREQRLARAQLERLNRGIEQNPASIIITDLQGNITYVNAKFCDVTGYTADEVMGRNPRILKSDLKSRDEYEDLWQTIMGGREWRGEFENVRKNGERYWESALISPIKDETGAVTHFMGIKEDITARRQAERAREVADRQLRLLSATLNCTRESLIITDLDDIIVYANHATEDLYGFPEAELIGHHVGMLRADSVPAELSDEIARDSRADGWTGIVQNKKKNGEIFPVELATSVVRNDAGEEVALVGVSRDITERQALERSLTASLKEKEILIREVHHRVTNNLAVISGLLKLEADKFDDETVRASFQKTRDRIRSMSLVHRKLYQSPNLSAVDYGAYIRELVSQMVESYGVDERLIRVHVRIDGFTFSVDQGIPCGIIITELVSNAFKHAFPGGRTGEVEVSMDQADDGTITLAVTDDGVGFPSSGAFREDSLGMVIIRTLVEQLEGTFHSQNHRGSRFTVAFRKR